MTYNYLVNGSERMEIKCRRGLRQQDPLLPLLLVLVADGLDKMLSSVVDKGLLNGLQGSSLHKFSNLQYADDTLLFGNCEIK